MYGVCSQQKWRATSAATGPACTTTVAPFFPPACAASSCGARLLARLLATLGSMESVLREVARCCCHCQVLFLKNQGKTAV